MGQTEVMEQLCYYETLVLNSATIFKFPTAARPGPLAVTLIYHRVNNNRHTHQVRLTSIRDYSSFWLQRQSFWLLLFFESAAPLYQQKQKNMNIVLTG